MFAGAVDDAVPPGARLSSVDLAELLSGARDVDIFVRVERLAVVGGAHCSSPAGPKAHRMSLVTRDEVYARRSSGVPLTRHTRPGDHMGSSGSTLWNHSVAHSRCSGNKRYPSCSNGTPAVSVMK